MDAFPQSPRLTSAGWHALLDPGIAEMEQLQAHYDADGANFLDGLPKELLPGLHYLGDFGGSCVYSLATPKGLYVIDAPGDPLLVDFLAKRFQKLGEKRKPTAVLLTSIGEEASAGMEALVQSTGCQVVAPAEAFTDIQRRCPKDTRVLTGQELEKRSWFDVKVIQLDGRGQAPVAYQVHWAGKIILFSGRIPVKLNALTGPQFMREVNGSRIKPYIESLSRLAQVKPDLWLPAVPVHGQNANLYGQDWAKVLTQNRRAFR
jgi:glyoxylase-like metal-dependent hydrolase (beta-lactamase superfamily II)